MSTDIPSTDLIQDLPVTDPDKISDLIFKHTNSLDLPPTVVEAAIDLFSSMYEQASLAGRGSTIGVAAAVRVACQMRGIPRSLSEIAAVTDSDRTLIARETQKIKDVTGEHTTPVSPDLFVSYWGRKLDLDYDIQQEATKLLADIGPERASSAAAAGALWAVLAPRDDRDITQKEISQKTHTSTFTLREVQHDLTESDIED